MRIAVLNGPSLNLLGTREPHLYGRETLADIEQRLQVVADELGVELEFAQRNGEGELVDCIQALAGGGGGGGGGGEGRAAGALINAGAYSHSSIAIRDAFAAVDIPFVEVHLTNIFAREPERQRSMLASGAMAVVSGFGSLGYELALRGLAAKLAAAAGGSSSRG